MSTSLWLKPKKRCTRVALARFADYPYFFDSFAQYGIELPARVTVCWLPLKQFLEPLDADNEEEFDNEVAFIDQVKVWMHHGEDIPPVLTRRDRIFDGRHRSWAAWELGLRQAPVVDITPYWEP